MAAPTVPTQTSLATEGLEKAGHLTFESGWPALLVKAKDKWMQEAKNDIWMSGTKLKSLFVKRALTLTHGQPIYSNPTDYASDMTMNLLVGTHTGTATAGAVGFITLAADEDITADLARGKKIIITSNTGLNSWSIISSYNASTKVATVSPAFDTAPDNTSGYLVADYEYPLIEGPVWDLAKESLPSRQGEPTHYYPTGDDDDGEFVLYPVPYRGDDKAMAIFQRYYMDLMEADLSSTRMTTFYKKARNVFIHKVYVEALRKNGDDRLSAEERKYEYLLRKFIGKITYGHDMSNLQMTIKD